MASQIILVHGGRNFNRSCLAIIAKSYVPVSKKLNSKFMEMDFLGKILFSKSINMHFATSNC